MAQTQNLPHDPRTRRFLFLQGPHGPFFHRLGKMLRAAGAETWRVGFNKGDECFWFHTRSFIPFYGKPEEWPDRFTALIAEKQITDIVLYGDTRAIHAQAVEIANTKGLTVHVFEEGYLRPYWVTYERGGSNGNSRLMDLSVKDMRQALAQLETENPPAPAKWGDMRQHMFYGACYHWFVMFRNRPYRNFKPHRSMTVTQEFFLYLLRLILTPFIMVDRTLAERRIKLGGFPYHLVLLQLEHDASFQQHSKFDSMTDFLEVTIKGFAEGSARHHHLVFKAHPLEDGRKPLRREVYRLAREYGLAGRVHYVRGGKLAKLLNHARSAVTVNSTAAQQVLWRGMALKVFGDAVYAKAEFVSTQALPKFFANPKRPDSRAYKDYRAYLLETSQIPGGFYSARGRRQLLRQVVDMMLAPEDPYDALAQGKAPPRLKLEVVN